MWPRIHTERGSACAAASVAAYGTCPAVDCIAAGRTAGPAKKVTGELPDIADWMVPFQFGLLAAAVLLPRLLIALMPGARRFASVLGLLNLMLTFFLSPPARAGIDYPAIAGDFDAAG